ncbi:TetR/AcrR family transcriptional regulator [Candidatus Neomarinimicrobiota bacterium]
MPRISKEYDVRRQEFLDAAQELFYSHGYEQTSVNMILDKVGVSKGTFYHYFESKADLLSALTDRISMRNLEYLQPIVDDQQLSSLEKLNRYFSRSQSMKTTNREILKVWLRVMYKDENVLLRHKVQSRGMELIAPQLFKIIAQGVRERIFDVEHPLQVAQMILMLTSSLGDVTAGLILDRDDHPDSVSAFEPYIDQFENAIERILGAPRNSIKIADRARLREVFK